MKHLIKKIVIAAIVIALACVGYMAIQRYYASPKEDVKIQVSSQHKHGCHHECHIGFHCNGGGDCVHDKGDINGPVLS